MVYITWNNRIKGTWHCEQLYVITTKGNLIVHRNGNSGMNLDNNSVTSPSWGCR